MNHNVRMLIGCLLPLILIFVLPLIGVSQGISLFIFIILMFGCHFMMMGGHAKHEHNKSDKENKNEQH
jgi:hypothetical protein